MTTATLTNRIQGTEMTRRPSLEELVDRLIAAMFPQEEETTQTVAKSVHDARRLRQTGDLDGALAIFAGVDAGKANEKEARWAYAEWQALARRKFGDRDLLVYNQDTGKAALLAPHGDGAVEVLAVLGMSWEPGKVVSRKSLRGLRPLEGAKSWS